MNTFFKQMSIALLLAVYFLSQIQSIPVHDDSLRGSEVVDSIIRKHWQKALQSNKLQLAKRADEPHEHLHHECIHHQVMNNIEKQLSSLDNQTLLNRGLTSRKAKRNQQYEPIRITWDNTFLDATNNNDPRACYGSGNTLNIFNYGSQLNNPYTCTEDDILSPELRTQLHDTILPTLSEIFSTLLRVQRMEGNLILDPNAYEAFGGKCDIDVPIPKEYTTVGIPDSDFVIFVTSRPAASETTVAFATACNFEILSSTRYGRPLAGIINFNTRHFQKYTGQLSETDFTAAVKVAVHELTHALGFSASFYNSYVDQNGEPYANPIVNSFTRTGKSASGESYSTKITGVSSPNVVNYAREHFGCSSLQYVELEDFGGSGTAGSHWERRIAGDEYMTGFVSNTMAISGLTLSLFEDMGWYQVNKQVSEYYGWGKDQGCDFVQQRCEVSWPGKEGYWCTSSSRGCSPDKKGKGSCQVSKYATPLPPYYSHYEDSMLGGTVASADYCTYTTTEVLCADTSVEGNKQFGEYFGSSSVCWEFVTDRALLNLACYSHRCNSDGSLGVNIKGKWLKCPINGGDMDIRNALGMAAILSCPPASLLCRQVAGFNNSEIVQPLSYGSTDSPTSNASTLNLSVAALVFFLYMYLFN